MVLEGTVSNVAAFGAFVDIGVHQDGLVHISQMSRGYVANPHDIVRSGDIVRVRVVEVDGVQYLEPAGRGEGPAAGGEEGEPGAAVVRLKTTQVGLAALEREQDMGRFQEILDEDAGLDNIYRMLLDCCSNEGGATAKELGDAVDDQPELQEPRLYASYFYDKMAERDLIEWTGKAWGITEFGKRAVQYLDSRA